MSMGYKIIDIKAREILDSRGNPTIEVEVLAEKNFLGFKKKIKAWSQVPSGASTGDYEAIELRDMDETRYHGKGVLKAIKNIQEIILPELIGMNVEKFEKIDKKMIELDGTKNKSNLGANAILGVSMAVLRLGAISKQKKLYEYIALKTKNKNIKEVRPFFNVINGGVHAGNTIPFQEFMISPNLGSYERNYQAASEIYQSLKKIIKEKYGGEATLLGDEGGFAPTNIVSLDSVFDLLLEAIEKTGYKGNVDFALDVAASEFFKDGAYDLGFKRENEDLKTVDEMIEIYKNLVKKYPIISIEDPFDQDDFEAFAKLKKELPDTQIVGDDLTVTNVERIQKAIAKNSMNALLLKLNQIGTVSEAIEAFKMVKKKNMKTMVSHRSGETIDDFIADFAVGIGAEQIKSGAPARGERVAKYNRLKTIFEKK